MDKFSLIFSLDTGIQDSSQYYTHIIYLFMFYAFQLNIKNFCRFDCFNKLEQDSYAYLTKCAVFV